MDREAQIAGTPIRGRWRDLEPGSADADPNKAFAPYMSLAPATPLGHFEATISSIVSGLPSLPEGCKRAVIYAIDNDFVYCDDGTEPDNTHGMPIPANTHFIYDTDPDENFLMWAATDTEIRVAYYG